MADTQEQAHARIPRNALVIMILLAGGVTMAGLIGSSTPWLLAQMTVFMDGTLAAVIVLAAGGYGYAVLRALDPPHAPRGLKVVTACALGLWMLSSAVLAMGSLGEGILNRWVSWAVLIVGAGLAMWQARKRFNEYRFPERYAGGSLVWVIAAVAAGFWLAGATQPPGGFNPASCVDQYDVLAYHLQAPREFFEAGRIGQLPHNCYSYYPLGVEMLFLLAMSVHGGAYEGVYLANMLHGAFGVLAVAGVFLALKDEQQTRGRFAAVMLGTAPLLLSLSWLAMVELGEICYLALALLWLRHWLKDRSPRQAFCIGLMLGAACAVKYLSVGLIVAPVLVVMAAASLRRIRTLWHVLLAGLGCVLLFSPWLIRNTVHTGNPVFPLATQVLGRGHWPEQSEQRWINGHGPRPMPPVPQPKGYFPRMHPSRLEYFYGNFLTCQLFGQVVTILAILAVCVLFAEKTRPHPWDWCLAGVLAIQLGVWIAFTHAMPPRFLCPALVPMSLLAAGMLARLAGVLHNPFTGRRPAGARGPWGAPPAVGIFVAAVVVNLFTTYGLYRDVMREMKPFNGMPPNVLSMTSLLAATNSDMPRIPDDSRFMLIGDARAFYFPSGSPYAMPFDVHPLERMIREGLSEGQILQELRRLGVTHVWVNWSEVWRLAWSYGYPAELSAELFARWQAGDNRPGLKELDALVALGAKAYDVPGLAFRVAPPWKQTPEDPKWPAVTIYALP